jgi:hypothetical protein
MLGCPRFRLNGENMTRRITLALLASLATLACASKPQAIPLSADPQNLNALVGNWSGDYNSDVTGRSGSIVFKLSAGKDTAFGDVVMVPRAATQVQASPDRGQTVAVQPSSQVLSIRFARLEGGSVSGVMNPYTDPSCGCTVQTTFTGKLTDTDTIEGTFTTSGSGLPVAQTGRWKVKRQ